MLQLNALYRDLLNSGFIILRQAAEDQDAEWLSVELEFLHNIPSLIGEENVKRHQYFWNCERTAYIAWISSSGTERQKSRMTTYYEPIWRQMEPLIEQM